MKTAIVSWKEDICLWDSSVASPIGTKFNVIAKLTNGIKVAVLQENGGETFIGVDEDLVGWVRTVGITIFTEKKS